MLWQQAQDLLAENCQGARLKVRAKNPSLLTGLLVDELGQPPLASHAVKRGRRYRYYVSASLMKRKTSANETSGKARDRVARDGWRIPAGEIDDGVIRILSGLLLDQTWLLAHMVAPQSTHRRPAGRPCPSRDICRALAIVRSGRSPDICAWPDRAGDAYWRRDLAADQERSVRGVCGHRGSPDRRDLPVRSGPSRRRDTSHSRRWRRAVPAPDPLLVKGLAQAHRWWNDLLSRRYATLREIAHAYQTDERYVARSVMLAFLPATLTQRILDGTHPPDLTLHSFLRRISNGWVPMRSREVTTLHRERR